MAAVARGRRDIVRYLLKKGADINAVGRGWFAFPLQEAAKKEDGAMVKLLLRRGADPNLTGGHLHTALIAACQNPDENGDNDEEDDDENGDDDEDDEDKGSEDEWDDTGDRGEEANADAKNTDEDDDDWDVSTIEDADGDGRAVHEILLDAGADVNAVGGHFGSALQAAHM